MSGPPDLDRRVVLPLAAACYVGVFALFIFVEKPGLGLGHFFYLPICLVALVSDEFIGAAAGVLGAGLYAVAVVVDPRVPSALALTDATLMLLVTFGLVWVLLRFHPRRK